MELLKDARAAKEYRDELDVLREKVDRLERLENECGKYKERLMELDFCKQRIEVRTYFEGGVMDRRP